MKRFYSNGKLLLTGEYLVLDGAKALALPSRFGQEMTVTESEKPGINWNSFDSDGSLWFHTEMSYDEITGFDSQVSSVRNQLLSILHTAFSMNGGLPGASGYEIVNRLSFPRHWGLGTSSTLLSNIARWLEIDAFALQEKTLGGSGYDIAAAIHDSPVIFRLEYRNPMVTEVPFEPPFAENLYFVYLNKKQDSREAIHTYRNRRAPELNSVIVEIDELTETILTSQDIRTFSTAIEKHGQIMSEVLRMPEAKTELFPDFPGAVKSLGAWGGDFILAVSETDPRGYFGAKGYPTILPYAEMIK